MDFTDCTVATPEPDADWALAIGAGGPAVGLSAEMPAFGDSLSAEQIDAFVAHLRGMCRETGWPIGNVNFPRPIFTEKAFPENEVIVLPMIAHRASDVSIADNERLAADRSITDFDLLAIFERRFGKRAMWEVAVPIASHDTLGFARRQGIGDVEAGVKYVLDAGDSPPHIVSAGFEVAFPTGSQVRGLGRGTAMFEPFIAAGTVWGSLYVQGQGKVELPADADKADRALVYNLYVGGDTSSTPNTWTLGVELNGENEEVALTPQVRKGLTRTGALAAALGVQIPMNHRSDRSTKAVGYLLWEYLEPVRPRK